VKSKKAAPTTNKKVQEVDEWLCRDWLQGKMSEDMRGYKMEHSADTARHPEREGRENLKENKKEEGHIRGGGKGRKVWGEQNMTLYNSGEGAVQTKSRVHQRCAMLIRN